LCSTKCHSRSGHDGRYEKTERQAGRAVFHGLEYRIIGKSKFNLDIDPLYELAGDAYREIVVALTKNRSTETGVVSVSTVWPTS
jgi:hypothetical protein